MSESVETSGILNFLDLWSKGLPFPDQLMFIVWFLCLQVSPGPQLKKYSSCSTIFIDDSTVSQPNLKSTIKWWAFSNCRSSTCCWQSSHLHERIVLHHAGNPNGAAERTLDSKTCYLASFHLTSMLWRSFSDYSLILFHQDFVSLFN